MGRYILLFIAVLGFARPALAQDIYGNSAQDLYGSPVSGNEATGTAGAAIEQNAAQEEAEETARQEARKQKRITRYEKQKKAFLASALTVGLVGGAGGIGSGAALLAIGHKKAERASHPQITDTQIDIYNLSNQAESMKKGGYALITVGAVSLAASIVLGVLCVRSKKQLEKLQVSVVPLFGEKSAAMAMQLTF